MEALGVASYIYVKFGPEQLSLVRLLCSFPFVVESLRERTLSRLLKMPLHSFETVLRRTHDLTLVASVRDGVAMTELRRGGRAVVSVEGDAFGTVMSAIRQEVAEHVDVDTTRFPFAPLTTNGIRAVTQLDGIWNETAFAEYSAHLEGNNDPLVQELLVARREWLGQPSVVNTMAMSCAVSDLFAAHRRRQVLPDVEGPQLEPISFQQFAAGESGSVDLRGNPAAVALAPAVEHLAAQRGVNGEWQDGLYAIWGRFDWFSLIGSATIEIPAVAAYIAPFEGVEPTQAAEAPAVPAVYRAPHRRTAAGSDIEAAEALLRELFPVDVLSPQQLDDLSGGGEARGFWKTISKSSLKKYAALFEVDRVYTVHDVLERSVAFLVGRGCPPQHAPFLSAWRVHCQKGAWVLTVDGLRKRPPHLQGVA